MSGSADGAGFNPGGRRAGETGGGEKMARNSAGKSGNKSMPQWLSTDTEDGLAFDLADPDDLLKKLESADLTEEETEELLKRAYEINKQLKQMAGEPSVARSAPGGPSGRVRSSARGGGDDHLPDLTTHSRARHTALSSGAYSRPSPTSPTSPTGSQRSGYSSYHGAQVTYGLQQPKPPSSSRPGSHRRAVYE